VSRRRRSDALLLSCEHAGNRIPRSHAPLFRSAKRVLESHRGWDPGALELARLLSRRLRRPLLAVHWSRLLVEANRSEHNPRIWSPFTAQLPRREREEILERWWRPHRRKIEAAVAAGAKRGDRIVHVAVHSFTPRLGGEQRNADIGLLYDSRRAGESQLCRRWADVLHRLDPELRVRFNYPYLGSADGLATGLRRMWPENRYVGVELEINQALVGAPRWRAFQRVVAESLRELLDGA
jgi:predicted N-formylglutamate amidohydrolase